jgi:hypothetical protein
MKRHALLMASAAMLLVLGTSALAQQEALGRLFYTPKERAALDANIRSITKQPEKPVYIPPAVSLGGIVTRSDGERTVWIDGRAYHQGNPDDIRVITRPGDPGGAELRLRGVSGRLPVRVGQSLDPASGGAFERYETRPHSAQSPTPHLRETAPGVEPALADPENE